MLCIYLAHVCGATFPGSAKAHSVCNPKLFASSKSIPPGLDAKSIIKHSFFIKCKFDLSKIIYGMVLNTKSNFPSVSFKSFRCIYY